MNMPKINEILVESNPWWKTSFCLEYKERTIYTTLTQYISLPQMIALTGLRRVGKTTLLYKIIQTHLTKKFDPKNIIYFSFDEFRETEIREILSTYEQMMNKDLQKGRYILLLDEIQKVKHWEEQLKRIYDLYGKTIKIIISGSESLFIKKKAKETLAGRLFTFTVAPLTFKEFLRFKEVSYNPPRLYEKELSQLYNEYIRTQGFPELIGIKEKEIIKKYIKESIIEKIIYRDIPQLYNIREISVLETILNILMEDPGQLIERNDLAKDLHLSRQTLSNYFRYLEDAFLIRKLYNYSKSRRKVERKLKKYYPTILSPDLFFRDDTLAQSKTFEGSIINQLQAEFFWRDPYKNEVDAIILHDQKPSPIEIKYGKIETKGLVKFMEKFHIKDGYIISLNQENSLDIDGKKIQIIPAYKFVLQ